MSQDRKLLTGKVPPEVLKRCVFPYLGTPSNRIIQGSGIGEDSSIIDFGKKVLIVKANPITGAEKNIGTLAVHINANDVAARGAKPLWFLNTIFLPESSSIHYLEQISIQMDEACTQLGIQIIGGHTECTPTLKKPIISGFMIGEMLKKDLLIDKPIRPGNKIILTKSPGIEGTSILATDLFSKLANKISNQTLENAKNLIKKISIVPEALAAIESGGVNYLHTPTEGGLLNGLFELSEALKVGMLVEENHINVYPETTEICQALKADPLKLMSSGSLLIVAKKNSAKKIVEKITQLNIEASIIGEIKKENEGKLIKTRNKILRKVESIKQDEVYRILSI
ncbi:hydrogenase [Candidatus Bathyarchaeota archaeon]|nr:hydrogenase [Candidatus Bathyarchaeota archaeon]